MIITCWIFCISDFLNIVWFQNWRIFYLSINLQFCVWKIDICIFFPSFSTWCCWTFIQNICSVTATFKDKVCICCCFDLDFIILIKTCKHQIYVVKIECSRVTCLPVKSIERTIITAKFVLTWSINVVIASGIILWVDCIKTIVTWNIITNKTAQNIVFNACVSVISIACKEP